MASITFRGLDRLQGALQRKAMDQEPIKKVVRNHGAQLQERMQRNAIFVKGYSEGATQQSIDLEIMNNGLVAKVGPHTHYAAYLEYGTRYMEAQSFVRPSLEQQQQLFFRDIDNLVK